MLYNSGMRYSLRKHVLAILRETIGLKQPGFAELLKVSLSAVQSVEVGRLKLSVKLAETISFETGADIGWLLGNDPTKPLTDRNGQPYSVATFENVQAERARPKTEVIDTLQAAITLDVSVEKLTALLKAAFQKESVGLCAYKLNLALDSLLAEFGAKHGQDPFVGAAKSLENFTVEIQDIQDGRAGKHKHHGFYNYRISTTDGQISNLQKKAKRK